MSRVAATRPRRRRFSNSCSPSAPRTSSRNSAIARRGPKSAKKFAARLPRIELFTIGAVARDWDDAEQKFFAPNGIIDTVYTTKPKPISE
jgi:ABC-type sulfate transport system substrate-binding protein